MHLFRALYLKFYPLLAMAMSLTALSQLLQGQWLWLAVLCAWLPLIAINTWRHQVANIAFLNDRERPAMVVVLLGLALCLLFGERGQVLWFTLAGLFALLFFLMFATRVAASLREDKGNPAELINVSFTDTVGGPVKLSPSKTHLLIFMSSAVDAYSRMSARDLAQQLERHTEDLRGVSVSAVFPCRPPSWSSELMDAGVEVLSLSLDQAQLLGLGLRGGAWLQTGGPDALRPALAIIKAGSQTPELWQVATNLRLPPTLAESWSRIERLL